MEAGAKQYEIAVIVTVFNKEKFLKDTLESILTQKTSRPFCIILSDDGSSDSSRQICADYAAKYHSGSDNDSAPLDNDSTLLNNDCKHSLSSARVCVFDITDGEHRGVNGNFLHCLKFSISLNVKYISQIDSDDILADPAFLDRQVSFLESHPEAQAACSSYFLINENTTLDSAREEFHHQASSASSHHQASPASSHQPAPSPHKAGSSAYIYKDLKVTPKSLLTRNNTIVAGGVTYRTDYLDIYIQDFASAKDMTQDLPLWLLLSQYGSFWGCDLKSLAYRNLAESVSRSENIGEQLKFQKASLGTRLRFIEYLKTHPDTQTKNAHAAPADEVQHHRVSAGETLTHKAKTLYVKKMLRHYAKLVPEDYPSQLKTALKETPSIIFSKDLWRSIGVYLKNR